MLKENEQERRYFDTVTADLEPVAWMYQTKSGFRKCWHFGEQGYPAFIADRAAASEFPEGHSWTPLYATPQPAPVQPVDVLTAALGFINRFSKRAIKTRSRDTADWAEDMAYIGEYASNVLAKAPAQRQPLTDDRVLDIAEDFKSQYMHGGTTFDEFNALGFARAIEAAHGIKEQP